MKISAMATVLVSTLASFTVIGATTADDPVEAHAQVALPAGIARIGGGELAHDCKALLGRRSRVAIRPGRISRSTRIVRTIGQYSGLLRARSSRSPRSGDCIIATNAAPHKLPS
jgi:hypothetical protein